MAFDLKTAMGGASIAPTNSGLGGLGSSGLGSSGIGGGGSQVKTTDELLQLALLEGGATAEAAMQLMNPRTSILSTMSSGLKKSFRSFVDIISVPSQVVAGAISQDVTIRDAIKNNVSPSDVIFGANDPTASTSEKIGNFVVRTATDVLLDPLTYVTFGTAKGIFGLTGSSKISLGTKAAAEFSMNVGDSRAVSELGQEVFKFLKPLEKQAAGTEVAEAISKGNPIFGLAKKELDDVLKGTIDAPLNIDFTKRAMSNLLERYPQLAHELLDKGGIKFFGKSILAGQRIRAAKSMIPYMSHIDARVASVFKPVQALFNPALTKIDGKYIRVPEEFIDLENGGRELAIALKDDRLTNLSNIVRANKLDKNEAKLLFAAVESGRLPADPRLANAFKQLTGYNADELKFLQDSGINISRLDNHAPHVFVKTKLQNVPFSLPPSVKVGAAMERKIAAFIDSEGKRLVGKAEELGLKPVESTAKTAGEALAEKEFTDSLGRLYKKGTATLEEIKASGFDGFDDNLVTAHAMRSSNNVRAGVMAQFVRSVGTHFGKLATEAPPGWVKVNSEAIKKTAEKSGRMTENQLTESLLGMLKGDGMTDIVFHPAVAKRIEAFTNNVINDAATNDLLKAFDSIQNLWKASVTSIFPQFHGRNAISNVFLHMMDLGVHSLNPAIHGMSIDILAKDAKANSLMREIAKGGGELVDDIVPASPVGTTKAAVTPIFSAQKAEFEALGSGHIKFSQSLDKLIETKSLRRDDAMLLREAFRDTNDEFLGSLNPGDTNKLQRSANAWYRNRSINLKRGIAQMHEDPEGWLSRPHLRPAVVFLHEYGHLAHRFVLNDTEKTVVTEVFNSLKRTGRLKFFKEGLTEAVGQTSEHLKYFSKNEREFLAESFAEYVISKQAAIEKMRPILDRLFERFKDSLARLLNRGTTFETDRLKPLFEKMLAGEDLKKAAKRVGKAPAEVPDFLEKTFPTTPLAVETKAQREFHDLMTKKMFTDASGYEWTFGELRQVIRNKGIALRQDVIGQIDSNSPEDMIKAFFPESQGKWKNVMKKAIPYSQEFALFKGGRKVGNWVEGQARMVDFIANLKATGDVGLAAQRTKQFLFDYQYLTPFEKTFMRRLIPFYTFTRKNLELQVRSLMTTPGRTAAQIKALNTLGDVMSGGSLSEEEKNALPDWIQSGIMILKSKKGSTVEILGSLGTPMEQPFQALQPNVLLGSISPLFRVPLEQASGYNFFQGKALSDVTNAAAFKSAPQALKDFIGFTELKGTKSDGTPFVWYVSLRPERMNLVLNLPPTSRVFSAMKQMQAVDVSEQSKILQQFVGVRPFSFDLEREAAKKEKELQRKLEDLLNNAGVVAKFSRVYIPKNK